MHAIHFIYLVGLVFVCSSTRNIPLAFATAMPLVMFLFVMANVSYFTVMSTSELLASPAVAIVLKSIT